jgi:hypothetical protein
MTTTTLAEQITTADTVAALVAAAFSAHGLGYARALRRLRRFAIAHDEDAWAAWARAELKREGAI